VKEPTVNMKVQQCYFSACLCNACTWTVPIESA
jgi:hypothetical protein